MATQNYFKAKNGLEAPSQSTIAVTDSNFPTVRPTLNLDFAGSESVDSRVTFTRASAATYFGADGKLKYAVQNEPRIEYDPVTGECKGLLIEEQRTNYLTHSPILYVALVGDSRSWLSQLTGDSTTPARYQHNYGIAPDGTKTTTRLTGSGGRIVAQGNAQYAASTGTYTFSVWVKVNSSTSTGNISLWSGVSNGVSYTASLPSADGKWYRVSISGAVINYPNDISIYLGSGNDIEIWGAQYELGAFATSYIPSTTSFTSRASSATYFDSTGTLRIAGTNQARYGYGYDSTSGKWVSQGLILEPAATNGLSFSSDYSNSFWNKTNATVASGYLAPDGSNTGMMLTPTATTTYHEIYNTSSIGITANAVYTTSVFFKAGTLSYGFINFQMGSHSTAVVFDLSNGTVGQTYTGTSSGTIYAATINYVGNGWYRCSLTAAINTTTAYIVFGTAPAATGNTFIASGEVSHTGSTSQNIYVWGAQFESGYIATSLIPTYGASATRAADVSSSAATTRSYDIASLSGTNFSSFFNDTEGTLLWVRSKTNSTSLPELTMYANTGSGVDFWNKSLVWMNTSGNANISSNNNSVTVFTYTANGSVTATEVVSSAYAYKENNSAGAINGNVSATDTNVSIQQGVNTLALGTNGLSNSNQHLRKLVYYPKRISNAQLQALTA